MMRKLHVPLFRGLCLVILAVISLFSLLEAGLKAGRNEYFNQQPRITHLNSSSIKVEWSLYPEFNKTTHYQVQLNNALYGSSTKDTAKTLTHLQPGGNYRVAVVTYDNGAAIGVSSPTSVLMAPPAPTGVSTWQIGTNSVGLIWQPSVTATKYRIYQNPDKLLLEIDASDTKAFLDGFAPGSLISLKVAAVNATGESSFSDDIKIQLLPVGPVISFVEDQIGATWFALRWQKIENASGYKILVNDEIVASVGPELSEYRVEGLPAGTTLSVKMTAVNSSGTSETSEAVIIQLIPATPVLAVAQVSSYSCTLQWSVANGAAYYKVYLNKSYAVMNVPSTINNVTLTEHITAGTVASYSVTAANGTGESEHSNVVSVSFTENSARIIEAGDLETVQASLYQFNDLQMPESLRGRPLVWAYFPPELTGPELALEVSFFDSITRLPEMSHIRFVGVFTREVVKLKNGQRANLSWKRAAAGNDIRIPGQLPLVRFYGSDGFFRKSIRIPMAILSPDEIYKELPESIEKHEEMQTLYQETRELFDQLHSPVR
jgi:hypothetical protein